jgi:peptidyl-prolyl cis-trans isomerase A (cyclophilin A)
MLLISLAMAVSLAGSQAATGVVYGRVADLDGAPVAGAEVAARPFSGGDPAILAAGADGAYRFSALPTGLYVFEVTAAGYRPGRRPGIVVLAGSTQEIDVRLERSPDAAQSPRPAGTSDGPLQPGEVLVRLETAFGAIDIAVNTAKAPGTAANFLKYVDAGLYDGGRFHRATRPDNYTPALPDRPMMEIIQGGINQGRAAEGFPPIPLERTSVTGLKHVAGVVSMARGTAADTARSDFFILLDDQPSLDFGGKRFADGQGGAAFGRVVAGLDVVRRIQQQPVQGQSLTPPVPITRATRLK